MYVMIDGSDGTGKTTLSKRLESECSHSIRLSFPTDTPTHSFDHKTSEILYYLNDFDEHIVQTTYEEDMVILDRSFISTMAYQGFTRHGFKKEPWAINAIMSLGSEMLRTRDDVYAVYTKSHAQDRLDRIEGRSDDNDLVSQLDRQERRKKLKELDRTFRRSYKLLQNNQQDFSYLRLNTSEESVETSVQRIIDYVG
jgi:thymidylate kinase